MRFFLGLGLFAIAVQADCVGTSLAVPAVASFGSYWFRCTIPADTLAYSAQFTLYNPNGNYWSTSIVNGTDCMSAAPILYAATSADPVNTRSTIFSPRITDSNICIVLKNNGVSTSSPATLSMTVSTTTALTAAFDTLYSSPGTITAGSFLLFRVPSQFGYSGFNQIVLTALSGDPDIYIVRRLQDVTSGPFIGSNTAAGGATVYLNPDYFYGFPEYYIFIYAYSSTTFKVVVSRGGGGVTNPITSYATAYYSNVALSPVSGAAPSPSPSALPLSSTSSSASSASSDGGSGNGGAIAGGVIGGLLGVAGIGVGVFFLIQHLNRKNKTPVVSTDASGGQRQSIHIAHTNPMAMAVSQPAAQVTPSVEMVGVAAPASAIVTNATTAATVTTAAPAAAMAVLPGTSLATTMTDLAVVPAPAAMVVANNAVMVNPMQSQPKPDEPNSSTTAKSALDVDMEYKVVEKKCGIIPWGQQTITIGETEIETHYQRSPFNVKCCAARMNESTHWDHVRLIEHTRGARLCSVLFKCFIVALIVGAIAYFANPTPVLGDKIGTGIGVFLALFLYYLIMWILHRKAWFTFQGDFAETSPMKAVFSEKGMRVSQWKIEDAVRAAWSAWARFRGFTTFDPLQAKSVGTNTLSTHVIERQCCIPRGSDQLNIIDDRAAVIKTTAGCCNLDCCTAASWQGFWTDDVKWVRYTRGNRTFRRLMATLVAAAINGGVIAAICGAARASEATTKGASVAFAFISWFVYLVFWFLSAKTYLQFGISKSAAPIVRVPRASSWDDYAKAASAILRRPADLSSSVLDRGKISGKNAYGDYVELSVTPDFVEIHTFVGRSCKCTAYCCFLCTTEDVYRVPTASIRFVHSSIQSIVNVLVSSFLIFAVFTAASIITADNVPRVYRNTVLGAGIGTGAVVALIRLIVGILCRKAMVVLGTPLSRHMTARERVLDSLGLLSEEKKYMFHVEFYALATAPEETVKVISQLIRELRPKQRKIAGPAPMTGLPKQSFGAGQTIIIVQQPQQPIIQVAGVMQSVALVQPGAGVSTFVTSVQPGNPVAAAYQSMPAVQPIHQLAAVQRVELAPMSTDRVANKSFSDDPAPVPGVMPTAGDKADNQAVLVAAPGPSDHVPASAPAASVQNANPSASEVSNVQQPVSVVPLNSAAL